MSHHEPPAPPPPPGSKPPGSTGPAPSGPGGPGGGHTPPGGRHPRSGDDRATELAAGGTVFAGMMLMIAGVLAVLEGVVGIGKDAVYVVTRGDYSYKFDVTAWGWIHLILGVLAVAIGYGLLRGTEWARHAGIMIAGLSLVANFMFLPYQPVWSIIMIAIDTFIIWSLTTYHPARTRAGGLL